MLFHRFNNHFPLVVYDVNNLNFTDFPGYLLERKADIVNMSKNLLSNDSTCCVGEITRSLGYWQFHTLQTVKQYPTFHHSISLVHSIKQGGCQSGSVLLKLIS